MKTEIGTVSMNALCKTRAEGGERERDQRERQTNRQRRERERDRQTDRHVLIILGKGKLMLYY